jgi:hypothetical protein
MSPLLPQQLVLLLQVRLGGLQEVSLSGLLGLQPLVVARDIYVGPGPVERSSIQVRHHRQPGTPLHASTQV